MSEKVYSYQTSYPSLRHESTQHKPLDLDAVFFAQILLFQLQNMGKQEVPLEN